MEKIEYGGWENCFRLANEQVEVTVTSDIGPRIIRLSKPGGPNMFKEFPDMLGLKGGSDWRIYGGHRLWHAPEVNPRTYHPDNEPVHIEPLEGGLRATQNIESSTGIEKQIDVFIHENRPYVKVIHRLINRNLWPVPLSVWALSVMAPGGMAIIPQPPYQPHSEVLAPSHPMVLWPYTTMDDERWEWGNQFIRLRQDPKAAKPQKIGMGLREERAYYSLDDYLFIKRFKHLEGAPYPDAGCSFETFTNSEMLEMESLGPIESLNPGQGAEHTEHWFVFRQAIKDGSEKQIADALGPATEQSHELMDA